MGIENFKKDFGLDLPKEIKQAIEIAKAQLDRGEGLPHQQVMDEVKRRFLKK